jgi:hypothetical protein
VSEHPTLDAAIKRGEIAQCPHCQTYWVASFHQHECISMVRAQLAEAMTLLREAQQLGNAMSKALGSDECTIPWDDDVSPSITSLIARCMGTGS